VAQLDSLGFRIVIYPGAMVRAVVWTAQRLLAALREDGTTAGYRDSMLDIKGLNQALGTAGILEAAKAYDPAIDGADFRRGDNGPVGVTGR
jgi:2-methylisocitrate lyase-like PEP mutase family enzyme